LAEKDWLRRDLQRRHRAATKILAREIRDLRRRLKAAESAKDLRDRVEDFWAVAGSSEDGANPNNESDATTGSVGPPTTTEDDDDDGDDVEDIRWLLDVVAMRSSSHPEAVREGDTPSRKEDVPRPPVLAVRDVADGRLRPVALGDNDGLTPAQIDFQRRRRHHGSSSSSNVWVPPPLGRLRDYVASRVVAAGSPT